MASSGMLRRVALVGTDVSGELTGATQRKNPEGAILQQKHKLQTNCLSVSIFVYKM
jgi:hypothetical protein